MVWVPAVKIIFFVPLSYILQKALWHKENFGSKQKSFLNSNEKF